MFYVHLDVALHGVRMEYAGEVGLELAERAQADVVACSRHKLHVVMDVVDHEQGVRSHFMDIKKVVYVGAVVMGACVA